jgi:hypothetical protein
VGAQLANGWPSVILTPISPPLTGKVIFTWAQLNLDGSGLRTLGTWNPALRNPQVGIVGPTALSFKEGQPGATGFYSVELTDLVKDGATVVWGGEAAGGGLKTSVQFDTAGDFSITVRVTDVDNVSATAATNVAVTETSDGHHHPP